MFFFDGRIFNILPDEQDRDVVSCLLAEQEGGALRLLHVPCQAGISVRPGPPHHWQASNIQCGGLLSRYALNEITYRCVQVITSHAMPIKRAHSNSGELKPSSLCNRITYHINRVTEPNGTIQRISSTILHRREVAYSARSHMPGRRVFQSIAVSSTCAAGVHRKNQELRPMAKVRQNQELAEMQDKQPPHPPTEAAGLIGLIHS